MYKHTRGKEVTKHTAGPWVIQRHSNADKSFTVGPVMIDNDDVDHREAEANAQLVSAAPELLSALKHMFSAADEMAGEYIKKNKVVNWGIVKDAYCLAIVAIAKAEGVLKE